MTFKIIGMQEVKKFVTPAKAGVQSSIFWIPACAGMTKNKNDKEGVGGDGE